MIPSGSHMKEMKKIMASVLKISCKHFIFSKHPPLTRNILHSISISPTKYTKNKLKGFHKCCCKGILICNVKIGVQVPSSCDIDSS